MTKLEFLENLLEEVQELTTIQEVEELLQSKIETVQTEEEISTNYSDSLDDEEEDSY